MTSVYSVSPGFTVWKVITAAQKTSLGDCGLWINSTKNSEMEGGSNPATRNLWVFFPGRNLSVQIARRPQTTCRFRHSCSCFCLQCRRPEGFTHRDCAACLNDERTNSSPLKTRTLTSSHLWAKKADVSLSLCSYTKCTHTEYTQNILIQTAKRSHLKRSYCLV